MTNRHLFDSSLYQFGEAQPSWWEASAPQIHIAADPLSANESCDVAIIGGGYTGLSAAYHLARDFTIDVRVLEAGHIGWGASGRNGGFCTPGGTMIGLKKLISKYGAEEARRYFQAQMDAVHLVRELAQEENMDIGLQGDAELVVAESQRHFDELAKKAEIERNVLGLDSQMITREEFSEIGYDAPHQHGALRQKPGFGIHPLRYARGLAVAAVARGAVLHSHSEVTSWNKEDATHVLSTSGGTLRAKRVIVACNGFMPEHLNPALSGRAMPLQSQIVVTRELTKDELAAHNWTTDDPAVNSRHVYYYYRMLPQKRLMIGGRADFKGTKAGAIKSAARLEDAIGELWPHWRNVEIEHMWRGFVCFTRRLSPAIGRIPGDPSVFVGFGYHGTGVNNATWTGKQLAHWLAGSNSSSDLIPHHLPVIMQGVTGKFPLPSLRPFYAKLGVGYHRFLDWMDGFR